MNQPMEAEPRSPVQRVRAWYALLLLIFGIFAIRLFYLQVIRYDYYKKAALSDQLKEYTVEPERGTISAQLGDTTVPVVLNQKLYTLYADPTLVKHPDQAAGRLQTIIGGQASDIAALLRVPHTRYVVLKKRLTPQQSQKVLGLKLPGVGTQGQDYRTYPQGSLAAQTLGFVDDEGQGTYGIEQALNSQLAGRPGQLKAVTDVNGIPLAANTSNLSVSPVAGDDIDLTLNLGMQSRLEKLIAEENKNLKAQQINALIMDPNTGAVKAMANVPTFDPAHYSDVTDAGIFNNGVVTDAIETGSIMKLLTTAAALNQGVITPTSSFYDPGSWQVDGSTIKDVAEDHSTGTQTIASTLNLSLNTGATWMLMQMGGGHINSKARNAWHDYLVNHYHLGQPTGIEQGYEASGYIPSPQDNGAGIDLTYANMSFGQGLQATPIQMGAAVSSILNGGTLYRPYLVSKITDPNGRTTVTQPQVLQRNVVSKQTSADMVNLMEYIIQQHYLQGFTYLNFGPQYIVGGKTGTAQVADANGQYDQNEFNGTYIGFVGGDKPQYLVVLYAIRPKTLGYAGTQAGQVMFSSIAHMLIDDFGVTPKSQ